MVEEKYIKDRWKRYFHNLFNERYEILPYFDRLDIREENQNYNYCCQVQAHGVKEVLKSMGNGKAVGQTIYLLTRTKNTF